MNLPVPVQSAAHAELTARPMPPGPPPAVVAQQTCPPEQSLAAPQPTGMPVVPH
jgi:hypothetical protein